MDETELLSLLTDGHTPHGFALAILVVLWVGVRKLDKLDAKVDTMIAVLRGSRNAIQRH